MVDARRLVFPPRFRASEPETGWTRDLQAFLDAESDTLVLPSLPGGWRTGPLFLNRSHRLIIFLPGCEIRALPGAFPGNTDCLITFRNLSDITLSGYGARLVMAKGEYRSGEWRHGLSILGCSRVRIEGVGIDSTGGDGVYISGLPAPARAFSSRIEILNCTFSGNRRQGISVISVDDLLIRGCRMEGTAGASPEAGLDFEPNQSRERVSRTRIVNTIFQGNRGAAAQLYLARLTGESEPVSVVFRQSLFSGDGPEGGMLVMENPVDGGRGEVSFQECIFRNPTGPAFMGRNKAVEAAPVRFVRCVFDGQGGYDASKGPVFLLRQTRRLTGAGGLGGFQIRESWMLSGGRKPFGIEGSTEEVAKAIHGQAFLDGAPPADLQPPPPSILGVRDIGGGSYEVRLANWNQDTVSHSLGSAWQETVVEKRLVAKEGARVRAVCRRGVLVSDTLEWSVPAFGALATRRHSANPGGDQ